MENPKVDIAALANLARLELSEAEQAKLEQEIPAILHFVETIQGVDVSKVSTTPGLRNVMREDTDPHESGLYTETLLNAAPAQKDGRVIVQQVISRDRRK